MTLTPEQFNKLVLKEDLEIFGKKLKEEITQELGGKLDLILDSVDGIAHKHQKFETELISNQAAHDRFETRITQLEKNEV